MWGRIKITGQTPIQNNWKQILPGLVISLLSLVVIFRLVDLEQLWQALQFADYRLVGIFIVLTVFWLFVRTWVWRSLLEERFLFSDVFLTINQGYLLNNLLPLRLGEIGRALLLNSKYDPKRGETQKVKTGFFYIISTILIERVLDLTMATALLVICLPFLVKANWAAQAALTSMGVVIIGLGGLFVLARNRTTVQTRVLPRITNLPVLNKISPNQIETFLDGLDILTSPQRFLKVTSLMVFNWMVAFIQYFMLVLAFFPMAKPLFAAFSLSAVSLGIAVPSSPGAVGILELAMVGALSVFKLDASIALALAITAHLTNFLLTGIIGAFAFTKDGQRITEIYTQAKKFSQEKNA